jgi:pimeloyl-ACP methyl ester carboxylesterase
VDLALLAQGFYIIAAPVTAQAGPVAGEWDDVYHKLVQAGFSPRPVLAGSASGAGEAFAWAIKNPDKVAGIYTENPVFRSLMFPQLAILDNLAPLVQSGIPLLNVGGSLDRAGDRHRQGGSRTLSPGTGGYRTGSGLHHQGDREITRCDRLYGLDARTCSD